MKKIFVTAIQDWKIIGSMGEKIGPLKKGIRPQTNAGHPNSSKDKTTFI
ncbi:hypothetical protein WDW89_10780 [Deltaproteobacteria bacterium TL4]